MASHLLQPPHHQALHILLRQGLEQCGHSTALPRLTVHPRLDRLLEALAGSKLPRSGELAGTGVENHGDDGFQYDGTLRLVAHPALASFSRNSGTSVVGPSLRTIGNVSFPDDVPDFSTTSRRVESAVGANRKRILIAIGPNGGWDTPSELDLFLGLGFQPVALAGEVGALRSEVAITALVH